ncbi:MAG: hypothetical protein U5L10_02270 [Candidatus Moranbacteria bacterium]|nr:hypothetical protein [Candidatus Moranbacteria bacterium]
MKLLIEARERSIAVAVKTGNKVINSRSWEDEEGLSVTLLDNIDKILKDSKLSLKDLTKVEVETSETGFSTRRIIEAVAGTVRLCLEKNL